jgi:adenylate cyclase
VNIEQMLSAVPVLADAAIGQAPFPLPKVPIQLNQFWCFKPGAGNVPSIPVVALHVAARGVFADFISLLESVGAPLAGPLFAPADGVYDQRTIIAAIRPLHALFQNDPALASRALDRLDRTPPAQLSDADRRHLRALIRIYQQGDSRYLNLYGPPGSVRTVSYHRLVDAVDAGADQKIAALLENASVFVGQTESNWIETHDSFHTAFSGKSGRDISGVEVAATAFANLLEDKAVYPLKPMAAVPLLLVWGFLTAMIGLHFSTVMSVLVLGVVCGGYGYLAFFQFASQGAWYPLVVPFLVQAPGALIAGLTWKHRRVSIDRENIREAFGYYLPDEVVDRLSTDLKSLRLGGRVFYGICLFTDASNYTTLSERLDPGSLTRLMNDYYEVIFKPIKSHGGLVLQVVGDSVMALWSAPEPRPALKRIACRAALEISAAVDGFNREAGDQAMPTRIGIHAGEMLLGNIGAMDHYEYRPVGDIVNTASRVEGLNKFLGTSLLVTRDVMDAQNDVHSRPVGNFVLKGKSRHVAVHELLPSRVLQTDRHLAVLRHFADGLERFADRQWDAALACFERALSIDGDDGPSLFYRQCCRTYRDHPPGEGWEGAVVLEQK